jgi:integrase
MKSLHPPKVKQDPTLPFTADEVNAIVSACDRFPLKGIYGEGNRNRLRAMTLLLRYSGLRIRDAATLRRERVQNGKLLLYMQKTGVPVFVPLPPYVVAALDETPNVHPNYFFWSGNGLPKTTVADWQRSLRKLFKIANVSGAHPHRFRDTFAVELLLAGVAIDQVSILLGHSSVKVTEKSYAPWVKARQDQLEAAVVKTWPPNFRLVRLAG